MIFPLLASCRQNTPVKETGKPDTVITIPAEVSGEQGLQQPPDPIASIREKVERINTARLETRHFEFICDEKMTLDYFYDRGEIVKISVDFGTVGDVYAKEEYYYENGRLIFVYEFVEGGPACEGCIKTNEYRSYIRDDKVIRYMKDQTEQKCRRCEFGPSLRHYTLLQAKTAEQMKAIFCK